MEEEIAVTGIGIISALGIGVDNTLKALKTGESGIREIEHLPTALSCFPAGEVHYSNYTLATLLGVGMPASLLRSALLGIAAANEAVVSSGLTEENFLRCAFVNGTTVGGMDLTEKIFGEIQDEISDKAELLRYNDCGYCTDLIADTLGEFRMVTTTSTACSSAANAIILGAELIRSGRVDYAVAGGTEALSRFHLNGFNSLMILDKERCRPFGEDRAGINLGEGSAYLVLEKRSEAERKGKRILAILKGWGNACDAYHQTATSPEGEGAVRAMKKALEMGAVNPSEIDYINAHGTGTPDNDIAELTAMKRIWQDKLPPYSSTKVLTGHTTSASGAIESVISILALMKGIVPGQPGNENFIDSGNAPVVSTYRAERLKNVICNSFGFGGNDSSLLFSKAGETDEREGGDGK
ncbi:MAG: beta-ketoacyl-[acyl-carrier-protein] synthase family protein [Muribaculaceae bacterium]|nr:beta-ketoacyl-[acyl-carrier-protein] synthase family protein [Muribaculaceae bacterium]